ncbi:MAG: DUF1476 domain-containing protein [Rhodospirillaceae bacterium]|nr:DUF1476 domain-containing protein [Rhodospirillaceae bacterium]
MTIFDERESNFEKKFKHDKELEFKAVARRNKLLGRWAAEQMGLTGDAVEDYAKSVVLADFDKPGADDVLRKIMDDFQAKGVALSELQVRKRMDELLDAARKQILSENKQG